jgi:hypothetical protein
MHQVVEVVLVVLFIIQVFLSHHHQLIRLLLVQVVKHQEEVPLPIEELMVMIQQ